MCRLLGIVSREVRHFWRCLRDESCGLAALSREHHDGWGVAVHDASRGWSIAKGIEGAHRDPNFDLAASEARGSTLLAHVRRRTVGGRSLVNTHPFRHKSWVFAHNGTIERVDALRAAATKSSLRLAGETDSEVLFAFLMGKLESCANARGSEPVSEVALALAVNELGKIAGLGASTFLLSNGETLFAYRHDRPLSLLERRCGDRVDAILVASEPVTNEGQWQAVPERTLLSISARAEPMCSAIVGSAPNEAVDHDGGAFDTDSSH